MKFNLVFHPYERRESPDERQRYRAQLTGDQSVDETHKNFERVNKRDSENDVRQAVVDDRLADQGVQAHLAHREKDL